jgi:hypothetical protein
MLDDDRPPSRVTSIANEMSKRKHENDGDYLYEYLSRNAVKWRWRALSAIFGPPALMIEQVRERNGAS